MWLVDTTTLTLRYVTDSRCEKYGILSHVWQADNELTFQEFQNGEAKHKSGYAKIVGTCEKLRNHGYEYAWVDSVCIRKDSSAELSEAINSMWQWYCDAGICLAYLEDISNAIQVVDQERDDFAKDWSSPSDGRDFEIFSSSKWFSRGWTLQELIAPGEVLFYNMGWQLMGRKTKMHGTLAKITGIDALVLEDRRYLSGFVAARKLSWAAHRSTTRIEDRAYCMLGIMDMSLPLLYGEGDRAFIRLQEEIIKYTEDQSVFAWGFNGRLPHRAADMLFADSPIRFKSCSRMVAWNNELHEQFRVTNRGVAFDGLFFDDDQQLAILNCRHEDNLFGPIALRVSLAYRNSTPTNFTQDEYWLGRYNPRTVVYDYVEPDTICTKLAIRSLTLNRTLPGLSSGLPSPLKLQICRHRDSAAGTVIRHAWPQSFWNKFTGLFSRPLRRRLSETLTTFLEIETERTQYTRMRFWLGIRLTSPQRPVNHIQCDTNREIIEVVLSYTSLEHVQTEMGLGTHGRTAVLEGSPSNLPSYQPPIGVAAQMESVKILGDDVLKIEILIGRHATLQSEHAETTVLAPNDAPARTVFDASYETSDEDSDSRQQSARRRMHDMIRSLREEGVASGDT